MHSLDFTKDRSVAVSERLQGQGTQGANKPTFGTGKVSLTLKVQGPPVYNSNYGQYNTSNHDLYHVAARFNSSSWRAPTDDSRLLWVYTASTRKLQYFISYEAGVYARWGNITVPQTAIDGQAVDSKVCFGKPWSGPGGFNFSGSPYGPATLSDWVLSNHAWTDREIAESFSEAPDQLPAVSIYEKITSWLKPGVFPEVVDVKGALTGGALYGGSPADFVT